MSKIEVNAIEPQCGTNLTVGASGDTITFPSGTTVVNNGSQTGFGRTGTVDWDTTAKTASFTAVSGNGYFVNTTSGAITVTLPASPSAGDIVGVADYAGTAGTNPITIARNGSNIEGGTDDSLIYENRDAITLVYVDGTQGWVPVNNNEKSGVLPPAYVAATGGTVTCCGDFKIHTFTGPGTFTVTCAGNVLGSNTVSYMVVAGGGGGGTRAAGGAGAGGFRESKAASDTYTASPLNATSGPGYNLPVTAQGFPITVGAGGTANGPTNDEVPGNSGSNSIFSTITSTGGGGGKGGCAPYAPVVSRNNGGSGGGGGPSTTPALNTGGTGNTPPVSPPQGNDGGPSGVNYNGGGGGGATAAGQSAGPTPTVPTDKGGDGGAGATTSISASPTSYAGGGGGGSWPTSAGGPGGAGGLGGGGYGRPGIGNPAPSNPGGPKDGVANTGGGGGGEGGGNAQLGGTGGSGIVVIRYKFQ